MKRFLTLIVAACAFFAASAQYPMVTLSHNGELSFFTNLTALEAAIDSAQNGDIIYLSEGEFIVTGGKIEIKKRLSIVGNGYRSHILGAITINLWAGDNTYMDAPLFDGVRLDYLTFDVREQSAKHLGTSEIRRCWIRSLDNGSYAGVNVTYDKCYIDEADFDGPGTILLKNSKASKTNYLYDVTAVNCNLGVGTYLPLTAISCILKKTETNTPGAYRTNTSMINTLRDFIPTNTNLYQHECYYYDNGDEPVLDEKLDCPLNLKELGYLGQDGTVVGIMGGEYPFSENPSVPTVDTANSSVEYDAENNKLKVSITVKAD